MTQYMLRLYVKQILSDGTLQTAWNHEELAIDFGDIVDVCDNIIKQLNKFLDKIKCLPEKKPNSS